MAVFTLDVGVKSDPIETRFSYPWLFHILAEEGIRHVQIGTFFEMYHLPDAFFHQLRRQAEDCGVRITSLFTAHRELGGFYRDDVGFVEVARRNYERYIEIGGLLGARSVGSNPGAVLRDRMGMKEQGNARYLAHMKELMRLAHARGLEWLTVEPMSCLAEPPTLPEEVRAMGEELAAFHDAHPDETARVGFCADVAHGYADRDRNIVFDNFQLLEPTLPWLHELHLKNTDRYFESTFGFTKSEREKGIVDVAQVRDYLLARADRLPAREVIGYLEIGGPKVGRDYTDGHLEAQLRESLRHVRDAFRVQADDGRGINLTTEDTEAHEADSGAGAEPCALRLATCNPDPQPFPVLIAPSLMCADLCRFEAHVRTLEALDADVLHFDLMDAHFTPNMPVGLGLLEQIRPCTALPFDAHLMVEDNDLFIRKLAPLGVQWVSVHVESARHLDRTLALLRDSGIKAGAALNPATPLDALEYVCERLDFVLLMTVNPGFAGQSLVPSALRKIADARAWLDRRGLAHVPLQVDGNVSFENIPAMVAAGAGVLVAGSSSLYHTGGSLTENAARMRAAIADGLARRSPKEDAR